MNRTKDALSGSTSSFPITIDEGIAIVRGETWVEKLMIDTERKEFIVTHVLVLYFIEKLDNIYFISARYRRI